MTVDLIIIERPVLDNDVFFSMFKGGLGNNEQLWDSSTSRCMPQLLEKIPLDSKCTLVNDSLGDYAPSSSQEDGLSSSSYLDSEKSDLDFAEKEVARSMMAFLLPQAIPLLTKTYRRRKTKQKKIEHEVLARNASAQNPSADGGQGNYCSFCGKYMFHSTKKKYTLCIN